MDGFKCIQVQMEKNGPARSLWMKKHQVREDNQSKPRDRTLFLINVPPYVQHEWMVKLFSTCGPVRQTFFHQKPTASSVEENSIMRSSFKVAYVVFEKTVGLQKALSLPQNEPFFVPVIAEDSKRPVSVDLTTSTSGAPKMLHEMAEKFLEEFDKKVLEEKQKSKAAEGIPDEDGWVTVTKSKNTVIPKSEPGSKRASFRQKKSRAEKELLNFYAFQKRDSKMEHLSQLRKNFQEDKERSALLRASRKFKPY